MRLWKGLDTTAQCHLCGQTKDTCTCAHMHAHWLIWRRWRTREKEDASFFRQKREEKEKKKNVTTQGRQKMFPKSKGGWLRPGGHKKAVGRARDGICEMGLPRVWSGDKWLWLVDVPPQSYILACNVSLVIPSVLCLEVPGVLLPLA